MTLAERPHITANCDGIYSDKTTLGGVVPYGGLPPITFGASLCTLK